ncbi:OmpA family protein [Ferrimonas lipolytica]|uniref:OmpA family protein n=1 Tax=Ferrimonas lipolytica TaxID=2724191 RepID=A0A6H1UJP4_9GAMM|nr:OmpA family protein [Ferrimonas lipolytica]QIZ78022.1 OmpA family protein [Ferrimonas lipolytica]
MNKLLLVVAFSLLSGCASEPLVDWENTTQQHDLQDHDHDGVISARENCIDTLTGANVDNVGCGAVDQFTARRNLKVLFPNDSNEINSRYYPEIESVAEFLQQYPGSIVTIEGHSSKVGSANYNLQLSQRRANAVRQVLITQFGIDAERVTAVGYGFDRPIDTNDDALAHSRNRRVVAEMATKESTAAMRWTVWSVGR